MILDSLVTQTKYFLKDEMGLQVFDIVKTLHSCNKSLNLRQYNSMMRVGGNINLMTLVSFEESLLMKLVDIYSNGVFPLDKYEAIKESVCREIINTILGVTTVNGNYCTVGVI